MNKKRRKTDAKRGKEQRQQKRTRIKRRNKKVRRRQKEENTKEKRNFKRKNLVQYMAVVERLLKHGVQPSCFLGVARRFLKL
jgi:hypothetical protein